MCNWNTLNVLLRSFCNSSLLSRTRHVQLTSYHFIHHVCGLHLFIANVFDQTDDDTDWLTNTIIVFVRIDKERGKKFPYLKICSRLC